MVVEAMIRIMALSLYLTFGVLTLSLTEVSLPIIILPIEIRFFPTLNPM